ncbi:MAG: hypothetical protein P1P82_14445 [Bacteroidales bacterium]|nr:hypothetical protein [Bacteroidales bacterium]MDT8430923.1 hypothetical protein [Bacteroidales bacterium]
MRSVIAILTLLLILGPRAEAQVVTVKSSFGSDSVMLGEHLKYTISACAGEDVWIGLPEYSDTITSEIEIIEAGPIDTVFVAGQRTLSRDYLVASFSPGWNTVPPQPVAFNTGELADTVYTTAQLLTVLSPRVDTAQAIMPIKPPVNTPVSLAEVLPWALAGYGALLLFTLVAALIWIRRQRERAPEQFIVKPLEPAHVIAFRELEKLRKENLTGKGAIKEYYTRLTWIIRGYMARQFDIHALESTTREIIEAFSVRYKERNGLMDSLEQLLMLADLVKFAKEAPSQEENERHLQHAEDFVEKTYRMFGDGEADAEDTVTGESGEGRVPEMNTKHPDRDEIVVEPKNREERHG